MAENRRQRNRYKFPASKAYLEVCQAYRQSALGVVEEQRRNPCLPTTRPPGVGRARIPIPKAADISTQEEATYPD